MLDLTKHLTARTDDSHAAPVQHPRRNPTFMGRAAACQTQVRFFALHRIKPHAPPLVRAPVNFFEFNLAAVLPRRRTYRVSYGTGGVNTPHAKCAPFTAGTTRVSNPVCSPSFRASASVAFQRAAYATGVLHDISAFHRYTMNSALPSCTLVRQFRMHFRG